MKDEVEDYDDIDVFWLKKHGYFCGFKAGGIKWTHHLSGRESDVSFCVSVGDENYIQFLYKTTNRMTGAVEHFDYKVNLITTPCQLGGFRYWFMCPLVKDGVHCGRRVAKLYMGGKYFGCRKCYGLVYRSQTVNWNLLGIPAYRTIYLDGQLNRKYRAIGRSRYYRGSPTKKYRSIQKIQNEMKRLLDRY